MATVNTNGNVLSVISDKPIPHQNGQTVDYWQAEVRQATDYSPFGAQLQTRNLFLTVLGNVPYRFGFQGQEMDDEIKGKGNSVNYTFRMHDPRLGRFFAIDPLIKEYPFYSSYSFSGNKVINSIEREGLEELTVFTNLPAAEVYYTSVTSHRLPLLFVTNSYFIRREFTTNEATFAGNNKALSRVQQDIPPYRTSNYKLDGTIGNTSVDQSCKTVNDGVGNVYINLTKFSNPVKQPDGKDIRENGVYPFTGDPANTVENNIKGNNTDGAKVSITVPVAGGANIGYLEFNQHSEADNFELTDEKGNVIALTLVSGGGTPISTYSFIPPTGANQLTLNVTPTTPGGGIFDAQVKTSGPDNEAVSTPQFQNPTPENVTLRVRRIIVSGRTASECGKAANQ